MKQSGYLLIDKPAGITSHRVVEVLRKQFNIKKVGHTGTLDPFATGLLVLGINEALKFLNYLHEEPKVYEATLKLGAATDTLDCDGQIVATQEIPIVDEEIIGKVLKQFLGKHTQLPPMFSAKKIAGKKMYELARAGIEVERKEVPIEIFDLVGAAPCGRPSSGRHMGLPLQEFSFRVSCSRGTYVRVLGADIAKALGTVGHLTALRRIQAGPFDVAKAFPLKDGDWKDVKLVPIESVLSHLPRLNLTREESVDLGHGKRVAKQTTAAGFCTLFSDEKFLGIGEMKEGSLVPARLLATV